MKAKLYVKGLSEPIELTVAEAEAAQKLIADPSAPAGTPFAIEGVWAGTKWEMKFVVFPRDDRSSAARGERVERKAMEEREATAFEESWQKPAIRDAISAGCKPYQWRDFFLKRRGVATLQVHDHPTAEYPDMKRITRTIVGSRLADYHKLDQEADRFCAWLAERQYAERGRLRQLDEMSKERAV